MFQHPSILSTAGASPVELATLAMHIMDGLAADTGQADARHIVAAVKALDAADHSQVVALWAYQGKQIVWVPHVACVVHQLAWLPCVSWQAA
jgi:hypothetical protein